jgi:hypothetical protein
MRAALLAMLACVVLPLAEGNAGPLRTYSTRDPLHSYNQSPVVISAQIRLAMDFEERAFQLLSAATRSTDDLKLAKDTVFEAYKMIRFAHGGVRQAQGGKFPDPTLDLQDRLMERARAKLRVCLTELDRVGVGQVQRLDDAHTVLTESYRILQDLQVLLP